MNTADTLPFVSVIIPVKNAENFILQCLKSLDNLNYRKDKYEVIISDSNSIDKTRELAASFRAKVVIAQGESVCAARNSGLAIAKGELIAFSDADCVMDKDWLFNAVKYFKDEAIGCVGGPSLIPGDETSFGKACGFIFSQWIFTGGSTYGMSFNKVRKVRHNPGCNAIYRRTVLDKVFPIDECFIEGEDVIMNKKIRDLGYSLLYTPDTKLWHYRSSTPKRFWRQNFRYAIGRVILGRAHKELINPLHIIAGFSIPLLAGIGISLGVIKLTSLPLLLSGLGFLFFFFLLGLVKTGSLKVALSVPYAIVLLATAWSLGFMREFFFPTHRKQK